MSRVTRGTTSGNAYLDLQNEARRSGRPTQELLQLYVLEGFLSRLAVSDLRDSFVLKGGMLLAAFDLRRPTKDVDLAGINSDGGGARRIRRTRSSRALVSLPFHVDVNMGDPIWPSPTIVAIPRLRGGDPIELPGYPMHMVHAEKIVTAIQRGTANTR